MKKFVVLWVLLLVAVAGLAVVVPYVIGGIAEQQMNGAVSRMTRNSDVQIKRTSFQRGLFSSMASYEISLTLPGENKQLVIPMHSVIRHGPFAGTLREVTITSTAALPPGYKKMLAPLYGDKPPLTVVATRSNDGDWHIAFHSPSFDVQKDDRTMRWQGIEARTTVHGSRIAFQAHVPGGTFSGNGAKVDVGDIKMSGHGQMRPQESDVSDFTFDTTAASLAVHNTTGDDKPFVVTGIQLHERLKPAGAGAVSYAAELSAADLELGRSVHATNPKLSTRMDGIDWAASEKLTASLHALKRKHLAPAELQKQLLAAFQAQLPAFLARSPKATVAFDADTLTVRSHKAGESAPLDANGFHASEQFQAGSHQTLAYGLEFSADSLKAHDKVQVTKAKVGLRLKHVYWGFLKDLVPQIAALEKQHLDPKVLQQREGVLFAMQLPEILSHSPKLRLTTLEFSGKSGALKSDGEVAFDGSGNLNLADKAAMARRLKAHLDVAADAALARKITVAVLTDQAKKAAQRSGKAPQPVDARAATGMLERLQQQGLLVRQGGQYKANADFKDAVVYVNGRPVADLGKH